MNDSQASAPTLPAVNQTLEYLKRRTSDFEVPAMRHQDSAEQLNQSTLDFAQSQLQNPKAAYGIKKRDLKLVRRQKDIARLESKLRSIGEPK